MSFSPATPIASAQMQPHPALGRIVATHRDSAFQYPISAERRCIAEQLVAQMRAQDRPIVLDAGCGSGESSVRLAQRHLDHFVVGIDQSQARLNQHGVGAVPIVQAHDRLLFARLDLVDFYLIAHAAGMHVDLHYLLYPNPWPKAKHLRRRWHGHAVWPHLLAIAPRLILRTNWLVYAQECVEALRCSGWQAQLYSIAAGAEPCSPFERKYVRSGHACWQVEARAT